MSGPLMSSRLSFLGCGCLLYQAWSPLFFEASSLSVRFMVLYGSCQRNAGLFCFSFCFLFPFFYPLGMAGVLRMTLNIALFSVLALRTDSLFFVGRRLAGVTRPTVVKCLPLCSTTSLLFCLLLALF